MSALLITIQNGTVDYSTDGEVQVVVVDFDAFDPDKTFPDDIDAALAEVVNLPPSIPWKGGVITRLNEVKAACKRSLLAAPSYEEP